MFANVFDIRVLLRRSVWVWAVLATTAWAVEDTKLNRPGAEDNSTSTPAGPEWWSLQKVKRPEPPRVKSHEWLRNPIDAFVLTKLEAAGLEPAPPADRVTLIRRATFDLLGLPPMPEEIDAFIADRSPRAYEQLIDRLLASPRYGERWGRHWLDLARFCESQGFERDKIRDHAWRYRDYVIRSFNEDKPYDQFVREQIAGDVLEPVTGEGIVATGFLVAGPWDEVGATQQSLVMRARVREEELEDMLAAVGQTFLGLTVNCARCHDHKFDPVPQRDYYRMKAALEGVRPGDRPILSPDQMKSRESIVAAHNRTIAELQRQVTAIEQTGRERVLRDRTPDAAKALPKPLAKWTFDNDASDSIGGLHGTLRGEARIENGRLRLNGKGAFVQTEPLAADIREKTFEAWLYLPNLTQRGGGVISLETIGGGVFDSIVFGEREPQKWIAGSSNFNRTQDLAASPENSLLKELIYMAIVYGGDSSISLYRNGVPYGSSYVPTGANSTLRTYEAKNAHVLFGLRHTGAGNGFLTADIEEARLYDRALSAEEIAASFRAGGPSVPIEDIVNALTADERRERETQLAKLTAERDALKALPPLPLAYAANAQQPTTPTFVLARGDVDSKGDAVSAGGLSAIAAPSADFGLDPDAPESLRRRKLADWIASPENPLTARVLVNRVWHYHFGRGIVGTPNDLGALGELPSHPELLDWLASEFVKPTREGERQETEDERQKTKKEAEEAGESCPGTARSEILAPASFVSRLPSPVLRFPSSVSHLPSAAWSLKRLHRLIMLSNTYQQSSAFNPAAAANDADSRLLWRFTPRRLEGEAVRDAMLAVSGQLNLDAGGPGYRPFNLTIFNSHFYTLTDPIGPEYNRRTVYRINVQSAKDPLLDSLDCPDPSNKTPRRGVTTTPLQTLGLMNNSFVLRQARGLAERAEKEAGDAIADQVARAYWLTLGRAPTDAEASRTLALAQTHGLPSVCWVLLNSTEFLFVR